MLTERNYLAPLRIKAEGIDASEVMGAVYVAVATEINLIRAIESTDDIVSFTATGRSAWTADCGNYITECVQTATLDFGRFCREQSGNVLNIDVKEQQLVTGLCLGYGSVPSVSIEYSADGENFSQAGTPVAGEYVTGGSGCPHSTDISKPATCSSRFGFSSSWSKTLSEIDIYKINKDPTVYAVTGTENLITGKITHRQTGSTSDVNASFSAYATVASTSGYAVWSPTTRWSPLTTRPTALRTQRCPPSTCNWTTTR